LIEWKRAERAYESDGASLPAELLIPPGGRLPSPQFQETCPPGRQQVDRQFRRDGRLNSGHLGKDTTERLCELDVPNG